MLVLIIGENGSGKNLLMVLCMLDLIDKPFKANFHVKHPKFSYLEFDDFLHIDDNTDVYIDEAYTWLESRRSNKASNVYISHMKEQKRKTNSTWYISEARPNLIDKRFEDYANKVIECKSRYPIGNSIDDFVYKIVDNEPFRIFYKRIKYEDAKKYFEYFDTNEKVHIENKQKVEFEIIKQNPKKLLKKVEEIAEIVEKDETFVKLTHPALKFVLMKNNILKDYEEFVYYYLKYKEEKNNVSKS